jgi:acyl dehydratase
MQQPDLRVSVRRRLVRDARVHAMLGEHHRQARSCSQLIVPGSARDTERKMPEIDGYEVLGLGLYFEDLPLGRKFRTIGRTLTEADLVAFIGVTGMTEVLFSNLEFLRHESDIQQRVVPAAMVYSFAEGLLVHATMQHTGFAFLHMELNVAGPTFAGDTIHVECEVVESRRSNSRPTRGLVRTRNSVVQQDGRVVLTYTPLRMVKARAEG